MQQHLVDTIILNIAHIAERFTVRSVTRRGLKIGHTVRLLGLICMEELAINKYRIPYKHFVNMEEVSTLGKGMDKGKDKGKKSGGKKKGC